MNGEYANILDSQLRQRPDVLRAVAAGRATPHQRHAYKAMQREAQRRASKWPKAD